MIYSLVCGEVSCDLMCETCSFDKLNLFGDLQPNQELQGNGGVNTL